MKIAVAVGTRPEIIKMAPVMRELDRRGLNWFLIHSGQHYSFNMDSLFFQELGLRAPDYKLNVGSSAHANQTGNILIDVEPILSKEKPDIVLVQGDTNTVLAVALAAAKLHIKVGHVEAGLRSYDRKMPEETNRVVTDHVSEFLFAVTQNQREILVGEGVAKEKIWVTGNTIVDELFHTKEKINLSILRSLGLQPGAYGLATIHRASNVDDASNFRDMVRLLEGVAAETKNPIVWPVHPRSKAQLDALDKKLAPAIKVIDPLGYSDFLALESNARFVLTDSGGVQEESCILGIPCLTLRENTERPETIAVGANALVGRDVKRALIELDRLLKTNGNWENPFGDGRAAQRIVDIITNGATDRVKSGQSLKTPIQQNERLSPSATHVSVVGLGYMGLPFACLIAQAGFEVSGVDICPDRVKTVNSGQSPFAEPGLAQLIESTVKSKKLTARESPQPADIFIVSVPTNKLNGKFDGSHVFAAAESLIPVLKVGDFVVIESTIKPGTTRAVSNFLCERLGFEVHVLHCPERAIPGKTLYELQHNDRVVGGLTSEATDKIASFYEAIVFGQVHKTDAATAECVKLLENTSRDVNIALANEFADILTELHVSPTEAIRLANLHPRVNILNPGPGVGGHCISIDPLFLVEDTQSGDLVRLSRKMNDARPIQLTKRFIEKFGIKPGTKVGVFGLAYKPDVDDDRESPAKEVVRTLLECGAVVRTSDPYVRQHIEEEGNHVSLSEWADFCLVVTQHAAYRDPNFLSAWRNRPVLLCNPNTTQLNSKHLTGALDG